MQQYLCLMYHDIGQEKSKYSLNKSDFIRQLNLIKENEQVGRSIEQLNREKYSNLNIALTFDDGNKSDLWAAEKLKEYGYTATFFMVEEYIKSRKTCYLGKSDVKEISALGHSIGVHGKSHNWWTEIPINLLKTQLVETKSWFEDFLGSEVISCSAPGGKLNNRIIEDLHQNKIFYYIRNSIPYFTQYESFKVNSVAITYNEKEKIYLKKIRGNKQYYFYSYSKQQLKDFAKKIIKK